MPIIDPEKNISAPSSLDAEIQNIQDSKKELPDKYKGKSLDEIAQMHMEAEKALSRQGQTVGEQRKVIDQFIQLQLSEKSTPKPEEKPVTTDALFEDPDKAIRQAVNQRVEKVDQRLNALNLQIQAKDFDSRHEGKVKDILSDPDFATWVQSSPHRFRLAQHLDKYDFAAGDELLNLWKDYREISDIKAKREEAAQRRQSQIRDAKTEGSSAGGEVSPKTIHSRVYISNLMTKAKGGDKEAAAKVNSSEWQEEIRRAYSEGRVR
jgi:hypothetical protein